MTAPQPPQSKMTKITLECGHAFWLSLPPVGVPLPGELQWCYKCGQDRAVKWTEVAEDDEEAHDEE